MGQWDSPDSSDQPGPAAQLLGSRTTADMAAAAGDQVRAAHSTQTESRVCLLYWGKKGFIQGSAAHTHSEALQFISCPMA